MTVASEEKRGKRGKASTWSQSARFRSQADAALGRYNRTRHLRPKCGAHARSTGQPCQQIAMKNGRCYLHGGRTPAGDRWHLPRWPKASTPNPIKKIGAKLERLEKRAKARRAKLASMSDQERAEFDKLRKFSSPGKASVRRANKIRAQQNAEAKELLADLRRPRVTPDIQPLPGPGLADSVDDANDLNAYARPWPNIGVFE